MTYVVFDECGEIFDILNFENIEKVELFKKNNPTYDVCEESEIDDFFEEYDNEIDE